MKAISPPQNQSNCCKCPCAVLTALCWLHSGPTALTSSCHELATAGTRMFGDFFGGKSPLKVRIYDFALYFDAKQVRAHLSIAVGEQQMLLWVRSRERV